MAARDKDERVGTGHPQRDQTDRSLREERDSVDAEVASKVEQIEDDADAARRAARERADSTLQNARDDADSGSRRHAGPLSDRERAEADRAVARERAAEDRAVARARTVRSGLLADFMAVERQATDEGLAGERAWSDAEVEVRDDFLGIVSHDLRGLLSSLVLNAELAAKRAPEGEVGDLMRHHAATSRRLLARMGRLVNDLVDIISIDAGHLSVDLERIDVGALVREIRESFAPLAADKEVNLDVEHAGTELEVCLDPDRILQVLANLVSNALKFTDRGGRVSIRVECEPDEVRIAVSDTGAGIPAEELQRIFERFRQVSHDRRGLGLGLYISRHIVEAHGGRIRVESELGVGSTFHVALPVSTRC